MKIKKKKQLNWNRVKKKVITDMQPWTSVQVYWINWTTEPGRKFPSLTKWLIWVPNIACCKWHPSDNTKRNLSLCCGCFVCTCFSSVTCSLGFSSDAVAPPLVIFAIAPSLRFIVAITKSQKTKVLWLRSDYHQINQKLI